MIHSESVEQLKEKKANGLIYLTDWFILTNELLSKFKLWKKFYKFVLQVNYSVNWIFKFF